MVDEVKALCDRLKVIAREAKAALRKEGTLKEVEQLGQVRGTLAMMQEQGLEVPEALEALERSLGATVAQQEQASRALGVMQMRLLDILRFIDPELGLPHPRRRREEAPQGHQPSLFE